jgi:hypothetical protein
VHELLVANSETSTIHVRQACENLVYQRADSRENEFATSINLDEDWPVQAGIVRQVGERAYGKVFIAERILQVMQERNT